MTTRCAGAADWDRHVTLALWVLAMLVMVWTAGLARPDPKKESPNAQPATFKRALGLARD